RGADRPNRQSHIGAPTSTEPSERVRALHLRRGALRLGARAEREQRRVSRRGCQTMAGGIAMYRVVFFEGFEVSVNFREGLDAFAQRLLDLGGRAVCVGERSGAGKKQMHID